MLAGVAAAIGGHSRPFAVATTRFILFLVIVVSVSDAMLQRMQLLLLIVAGALWTMLLNLLFDALAAMH